MRYILFQGRLWKMTTCPGPGQVVRHTGVGCPNDYDYNCHTYNHRLKEMKSMYYKILYIYSRHVGYKVQSFETKIFRYFDLTKIRGPHVKVRLHNIIIT